MNGRAKGKNLTFEQLQRAELFSVIAKADELRQTAAAADRELVPLKAELANLQSSASWKVTRPFRVIVGTLRRLRSRT